VDPENKIITYLMFTAMMATTFISAIAISKHYYSVIAWIVLLAMNMGTLIYLLRKWSAGENGINRGLPEVDPELPLRKWTSGCIKQRSVYIPLVNFGVMFHGML